MPVPPYAQLLAQINGGAPQTGGITSVPASATVQLVPGSTVGWKTSATVYQITAFPPGWPSPTGWTFDSTNQLYYYFANGSNGTNPPPLTMPSSGQIASGIWGKWKFRLLVNGGGGQLTDASLALEIDSSTGIKDIAVGEGTEFGGPKKWVAALQANLRALDAAIRGGLGGGASLGSGTPATVSAAAGAQGALSTAAPFDHSHQVSVGSPVTIATSIANGSSNALARADHVHSLTWSTVVSVFGSATTSLGMNGQKITGLGTPTASSDAVTKAYADVFGTFASVNAALATANAPINVNGQKITGLGTPTPSSSDAATTAYVDASVGVAFFKAAVRGASLGNQSLSGALTEDGITYNDGDRYLAKDQGDQTTNGIYVVNTAGAWTHAPDFTTSAQVGAGLLVLVSEGSVNKSTGWQLSTPAAIVLGTSIITFTKVLEPISVSPTARTAVGRGTSAEVLAGWVAPDSALMAASGFVRMGSGMTAVAFRGAANTHDVSGLAVDGADGIQIGDATYGLGYVTVNVHGSGMLVKDNGTEVFAVDSALGQVRSDLQAIGWGPFVSSPFISQRPLSGTGAGAGQALTIQAQQGQAQTGGANNNNGGSITVSGGDPGTGGGGTAGVRGSAFIKGGSSMITLSSVAMVLQAPLFVFDSTVSTPFIEQAQLGTTGSAAGQAMTVQAQQGQQQTGTNANTNGGNLTLAGGAPGTGGSGAAGAQGTVALQGASLTVTLDATGFWTTAGIRGGFFSTDVAANVAAAGALRLPAGNQNVVAIKGQTHATVQLIGVTGTGATLQLGDATEITSVDVQSANLINVGPNLAFASGVTGVLGQIQVAGTGAAAGTGMTIRGQQGQNVSGGTNNNGGSVTITGGLPGTGGTGGSYGNVVIQVNTLALTVSSSKFDFGTGTLSNVGFFQFSQTGSSVLTQQQQSGTGTNPGNLMSITAQQGQNQTGGANNNNGGNMFIAAGSPGTGGGGSAGLPGQVTVQSGGTNIVISSTAVALAVSSGPTATLGTAGWRKIPGITTSTANATPVAVYTGSLTTTYDVAVKVTVKARITSGAHTGQNFTMERMVVIENPSGTPVISTGTVTPTNGITYSNDETSGTLVGTSILTVSFAANSYTFNVVGLSSTNIDWWVWVDEFVGAE